MLLPWGVSTLSRMYIIQESGSLFSYYQQRPPFSFCLAVSAAWLIVRRLGSIIIDWRYEGEAEPVETIHKLFVSL